MSFLKKAVIQAVLHSSIQNVWAIITDNQHYAWRSDLSKIDVTPDGQRFTEYTKNGFPTVFTITCKDPPKRYEFDIQNRNLHGHWVGTLQESKQGTLLTMSEEVSVANPIINLFAAAYLKKQQAQYIADLRKVLGE